MAIPEASDLSPAMEQLLVRRLAGQKADSAGTEPTETDVLARAQQLRREFMQMYMQYEFGIAEVSTKVDILRKEFERSQSYSPIEHVRSRLKSPESLFGKLQSRGIDLSVEAIRAEIFDIAGIRISCSFVSDVYWIAEMLSKQADLRVVQTKDYIAHPKANGYRSLHLILEVPVFLSDRTAHVPVELQIRTIAMDFWASMEHKLNYKYSSDLPAHLAREIEDAARVAADLDERMSRLRDEIRPDRD